jgi:uncharacterized protein YoxC
MKAILLHLLLSVGFVVLTIGLCELIDKISKTVKKLLRNDKHK